MPMSPRLLRPRAAAATGFNPRTISGLQLWFDGADSSTLFDATSGGSAVNADGAVARWQDKSGNNRHATQGTENNRPTRKQAVIGGKDAILFDPTTNGDFLKTGTFSQSQPNVWFAVASHANQGGAQSHIFDGGSGRQIIYKTNNSAGGQLFAGAGSITANNVFLTNTPCVVAGILNSANSQLRRNGSTVATGTLTGGLTGGLLIGVAPGENSGFWNGTIAEILMYSGALSAASISAVERYLGSKWGVTVA